MAKYLLGIDVGTTGSKALIIDLNGGIIASGYKEYDCEYPKPNWVEQNANTLIDGSFEACKEAIEGSSIDANDIAAVGFSTQRATFGFVDANGEIIGRNFYGWQDNRAISEIDYITSKISAEELYLISGIPITPTFSFAKIIWVMRNDREKYEKSKYIVQLNDYVLYRYGSDGFCCEMTNACVSGLMDLKKMVWSEKILETYDIDKNKLPPLVKAGQCVGKITKEVASKTGLIEGTPIVAGSGDQQCSAIGSGIVKHGYASMSLGTSGLVIVGTEKVNLENTSGLMVPSSALHGFFEIEGIQ